MKKVASVEFNNFRAFKGNEIIDFRNNNGQIADLICIYGQNGMGKTSFFDGIEWFSSGEIDKFEDKYIIKELNKYEGNILKNIYSDDEESYVKVAFSDDDVAKRKTLNKKNSKNDYLKGTISPKKFNNVLLDKQILPHSKIDSFVYADNPASKYIQWGGFWDPSKKQRELFEKIYLINKNINKKLLKIKCEKENIEEQLSSISIIDEKIKEINYEINLYNSIKVKDIEEIELIKKENNEILKIPNTNNINKIKIKLITLKDDIINRNRKILYLIKYYEYYCSEMLVKNNLELKRVNKKIDFYKELYEVGEYWFDSYEEYKKITLIINNKNDRLKLLQSEIKNLLLDKNKLNEQLNNVIQKINSIEENKLNILNDILKINEISNEIINLEQEKENVEKRIIECFASKAEYSELLATFESFIYKNRSIEFYRFINRLPDVDGCMDEIKKEYEEKAKETFYKIDSIKKKIAEKQKLYNESLITYENLEDVSVKVREYVLKNNDNICPICKTEFRTVSDLMSKINLTDYQKITESLYLNLEEFRNELKRVYDENNSYIDEWNKILDKTIIKLDKSKAQKENEILESQKNKINISKNIDFLKQDQIKIKESILEFGSYNGEYTKEAVEEWIDSLIKCYRENKSNIEEKILKLIIVQEKIIKECEEEKKYIDSLYKKHRDYSEDQRNINLISKIDTINNENIEWREIKEFYENLNEKYNYVLSKQKKIEIQRLKRRFLFINDCILGNYEIYEEDLFKQYGNELYNNEIDLTKMLLETRENIRKISQLNIKINSANYILSENTIWQYNNEKKRLNEKLNKIEKDISKYDYIKREVGKMFDLLKNNLELNIKKVFGSKTINQIYKEIEPHKEFTELNYEVSFNDKDIPELYIKGKSKADGKEVLPEFFYSSAQLNSVALSIFLAGALTLPNISVNTIFIDDPVGHFDDINVLSFVDLLRNIIKEGKWQIVISTHDESFYNILKNKISNEYYNSKFIKFYSLGKTVDDI